MVHPGVDVIAHVKAALEATAVDDEVSEYVADMANELLTDGDEGRSRTRL